MNCPLRVLAFQLIQAPPGPLPRSTSPEGRSCGFGSRILRTFTTMKYSPLGSSSGNLMGESLLHPPCDRAAEDGPEIVSPSGHGFRPKTTAAESVGQIQIAFLSSFLESLGNNVQVFRRIIFAPLAPQIRTDTVCHFIQFNPNLWGEMLWVRGK